MADDEFGIEAPVTGKLDKAIADVQDMVKNTAGDLLKDIKGAIDEQTRKDSESAEKAGEFWENRFKKQEELIEKLQKDAEQKKGPKKPRKPRKPALTEEQIREMIRSEMGSKPEPTPAEEPAPEPEDPAEPEDTIPSDERSSKAFTQRIDNLKRKKTHRRSVDLRKQRAAQAREQKKAEREAATMERLRLREEKKTKQESVRANKARIRDVVRKEREGKNTDTDMVSLVQRGLGISKSAKFPHGIESSVANTLIKMLRGAGPHGAAVAAALVAGPAAAKMFAEFIKFMAQKGHPLNRDFYRVVNTEDNSLMDEYEKTRRKLAIDPVIFAETLGYDPLTGSTSHNSLDEADEMIISKIGLAEKAVGIHYAR